MASLGHQPTIKKQVAAGHVGFNTLAALIGMFGMPFILWLFTTSIFPKVGVVMGLSIFYIAMRLFTAILVFPFIDFFTRLIQKLIKEDEAELTLAIQKIPTESVDPELVLLAIKQDLLVYFKKIISYNLNIWDFYLTDISQGQADMEKLFKREVNLGKNYLKKEYQETKGIQEQLLNFLVKMNQVEVTKAEDADQLTSLYQVVIDIGDSSKYLKDVWDRVEDRQRSTSEDLQKDYNTLRKMVLEFYTSVLHLLAHIDDKQAFALLHGLLDKIKKNDKKYLMMFKHKEGDDVDLANLIQVSRYFSMSCFSLVRALENVSLSEEDKKYLKEHINALF
jgi:Na+/phosphate symporter